MQLNDTNDSESEGDDPCVCHRGCLPSNYIDLSALCQSRITVSSRDTGFISKDRQNEGSVKLRIST